MGGGGDYDLRPLLKYLDKMFKVLIQRKRFLVMKIKTVSVLIPFKEVQRVEKFQNSEILHPKD